MNTANQAAGGSVAGDEIRPPEMVVAQLLKRLYPQNPDVVLGREARLIVTELRAEGWEVVCRG